MKNIFFFIIFSAGILMACENHDNEAGHSHDAEHTDEAQSQEDKVQEEVELSKDQFQKIGLKIGKMEQKTLQHVLKVNGRLELPPQNEATVSGVMGGLIQQIFVRQGEYVKKGKALASITHPDFISYQETYYSALAETEQLEKALERQQVLAQQEIPAQKQLDELAAKLKMAKAKANGAKAKLDLLGIRVDSGKSEYQTVVYLYAPIGGYVRNIHFNTGAYITPQDAVFEIVDNHHIHIDLLVYEQDVPSLEVGQKISFMLQSNPRDLMEARIFAIGKALEEEERAVRVHAEIENEKGNLLPGMYVEARVILNDEPKPCLPQEAIATDKGLAYIFVLEEVAGGMTHFKKVQVLTGISDRGYTEVTPLEELAPETQIVHEGAYFLMAQTKKGEGGGGHHHH